MTPDRIDALLTRALAHSGDTHTPDDVLRGVAAGDFQLWTGDASVIVTEIIRYPRRTDLHMFLAAGDMAELRQMQHPIFAWAKGEGCTRATLTGRKGWDRSPLVTQDGWTPEWTTCVKSLTDETEARDG